MCLCRRNYLRGGVYESTGGVITKYYTASGGRLALRVGDDLTYLFGDHLGSTSATYRVSDATTTRQLYKPWGEPRYASSSLPTPYTYTGQYHYTDDITTPGVTEGFGLMFYNARWYDPALSRFTQPDSIIPDPNNPIDWDRYGYSYGNPVKYIDPDGHWPCSFSSSGFSCSVSTFGLGGAVNRVGGKLGVKNASDIVSGAMSTIGLGLDIAAEAIDFAASAIVTTGIVVGATGGVAITLPGGGMAVVTGTAGASVGWATAEIGVRPLILAGNALASFATGFTVGSDLISGDTGFESTLGISSEGVEMNSQVAVGSASQVSTFATTAGWISPLAYPSLLIQTGAVLGDLGVISPPPIKMEFRLKRGELDVR